ncbi:hypothetical protein FOA52_002965 [Chlamydomonas sp. UWO 241]|nr:hypothetical protein FOA52_002965 [Chlamydomonas sp. UWO 241]
MHGLKITAPRPPPCAGTLSATLQGDAAAAVVVEDVETLGGGSVTITAEQVPAARHTTVLKTAENGDALYAYDDAVAAGQVLRVAVAPGAEATVVTIALRGLGAWAVYGVDAALLPPEPGRGVDDDTIPGRHETEPDGRAKEVASTWRDFVAHIAPSIPLTPSE